MAAERTEPHVSQLDVDLPSGNFLRAVLATNCIVAPDRNAVLQSRNNHFLSSEARVTTKPMSSLNNFAIANFAALEIRSGCADRYFKPSMAFVANILDFVTHVLADYGVFSSNPVDRSIAFGHLYSKKL